MESLLLPQAFLEKLSLLVLLLKTHEQHCLLPLFLDTQTSAKHPSL